MKRTISLLTFALAFSSITYGQKTLSAKGYFCGQTEPTAIVNIHLMTGNSVKFFLIGPDSEMPIRGAKNKAFFELPIGTELIMKYKVTSSAGVRGNWIQAASVTGRRNRNISRCASD